MASPSRNFVPLSAGRRSRAAIPELVWPGTSAVVRRLVGNLPHGASGEQWSCWLDWSPVEGESIPASGVPVSSLVLVQADNPRRLRLFGGIQTAQYHCLQLARQWGAVSALFAGAGRDIPKSRKFDAWTDQLPDPAPLSWMQGGGGKVLLRPLLPTEYRFATPEEVRQCLDPPCTPIQAPRRVRKAGSR